MILCYFEN